MAFRDAHPLAWTFHRNTERRSTTMLDGSGSHFQTAPTEYLHAPFTRLPAALPLEISLGHALSSRCSCRAFSDRAVPLAGLGTVLWNAYGVIGRSVFGCLEFLDRPVPSAGGLYPLELYLLIRRVDGLGPGIYHYAPVSHGLEMLRDVLVPQALSDYLFMGQSYITNAAAVLVVAAEMERSLCKYGDRGYRYVLFEAGHCVQNVNLVAATLGLGTCNAGGFFDDELGGLLTLDIERELPLYAVAIGHPEGTTKDQLRAVMSA